MVKKQIVIFDFRNFKKKILYSILEFKYIELILFDSLTKLY